MNAQWLLLLLETVNCSSVNVPCSVRMFYRRRHSHATWRLQSLINQLRADLAHRLTVIGDQAVHVKTALPRPACVK